MVIRQIFIVTNRDYFSKIAISNILISVCLYRITISQNKIHEILLLRLVSGLQIPSWLIHFKNTFKQMSCIQKTCCSSVFPRGRLCLCICMCIFTLIYFHYHWNHLLSSIHFPRRQFFNIHFNRRFTTPASGRGVGLFSVGIQADLRLFVSFTK